MAFKTIVGALVIAAVLSLGIFSSGYFAGRGFYKSRMDNRFVTVKGLSERDVAADLAM